MDEVERRVVAHEMALIEVCAYVGKAEMLAGIKSIRAGIVVGITAEEREIRYAAIEMLEAALHRHDPPAIGMFLQRRTLK